MGASPVSRIVETKGRTPAQIWDAVHSDALDRHGYEYSGDFGSKHGFVVVARLPDATKDVLEAINLIDTFEAEEDEGDGVNTEARETYDPFPLTARCPGRCGRGILTNTDGKVTVEVMVKIREVVPKETWQGQPDARQWLPSKMLTGSQRALVERDCRVCKGTGIVPLTGDELKAQKQRRAEHEKRVALLAHFPKREFAQVYNDKWGPAAMVIGKDHTYVGGYCSS